jgi:uncharacterized membrane protein YoaK (UPF0700 family)
MNDTSVLSERPTKVLRKFRHLLPGAAAMAATAGYVNSVVLGFFHTPVSHMTGAVSRTGVDLAEHRACGLQSAIGSSYCGLQIRTTHITGMVTDLGTMIGHWIRHRWVDRWKFIFFLVVFLAFGVGGYVGAIADGKYGPIALMLPAVAVFLAGVVYYPFVHMATTDLLPDAPPRSFAAEPDGRSAIQAHSLPESPPGGSSPAASDPLLRRRP